VRGTPLIATERGLPTKLIQPTLLQLGNALPNLVYKFHRRLQYNPIWKPQDSISPLPQLLITLPIALCLRLVSVPCTIEFNHEFQRQAAEIHNHSTQGHLAAKLVTKQLAIAEKAPSKLLSKRVGMAQFFGARGQQGEIDFCWPNSR